MPSMEPAHRVVQTLHGELLRQGISTAELARRTEKSYSAVSRRFTGEVPMSIDELEAFAAAGAMRVDIALSDTLAEAGDQR